MIDYRQELLDRGYDPYDSGSGYVMMHCPLPDHDDENPSFSVSLQNGSWRCFGCEEHGSFVDLVCILDGVNTREALRRLRSTQSLDDVMSSIERTLDEGESNEVEFFSLESFHKTFPPVEVDSEAWKYLLSRKLTPKTIRRFDFRWADHGKYVDRVILPIKMPNGKLLSYVGRTIRQGVLPKTRKSRSPARTLYGIYELTKYFGATEYIVLVEGEFDAIYLQQEGVPAVANMGTSPINAYQLQILRHARAKIVVSYDGDEAGTKAMYGEGSRDDGTVGYLRRYMATFSVDLPQGKDPNGLSRAEVRKLYHRYG